VTATTQACPCCGYATLSERGGFEICEVCFWEDDGQDSEDADIERGGPNQTSLTVARRNYLKYRASDERAVAHVRSPRSDEPRLRRFVIDGEEVVEE